MMFFLQFPLIAYITLIVMHIGKINHFVWQFFQNVGITGYASWKRNKDREWERRRGRVIMRIDSSDNIKEW